LLITAFLTQKRFPISDNYLIINAKDRNKDFFSYDHNKKEALPKQSLFFLFQIY